MDKNWRTSFWSGARRSEEYEKDTCKHSVAFVGLRFYVRGAERTLCVDNLVHGGVLCRERSVMYGSK